MDNQLQLKKKREQFRIKIRRQANQQYYKQRRLTILKNYQQNYIDFDLFLKLLSIYTQQSLPQHYQPQPEHIITMFSILSQLLIEPSNNKHSLEYFDLLLNAIIQQKKAVSQQIIIFFKNFIHRVSYKELSKFKLFQKHTINILQIITSQEQKQANIEELGEQLLRWCEGTQSITIIYNCIKQFLNVNVYHHIYQIIQNCFKSPKKNINKEAAHTIIKIFKYADWDDAYQIYFQFNGIAIEILNKFDQTQQNQSKQLYAEAIINLINTYQSYMIDYAKAGVGLMVCKLLMVDNQKQNNQGLILLQMLSSVTNNKMQEYLLEDNQIKHYKLWITLLKYKQSSNVDNKINFYNIIVNMVCNGKLQQIDLLNSYLDQKLLDIAQDGCFQRQYSTILIDSLKIIQVLLYYAESIKMDSVNVIAAELQKRGLVTYFKKLQLEEKSQQIYTIINEILRTYFDYD